MKEENNGWSCRRKPWLVMKEETIIGYEGGNSD
jgi:hypothetical protein